MKDKTKKYLKGTGIAALIAVMLSGVDLTTLLDRADKPADEVSVAVQKLEEEVKTMRVMAEHRELQYKIRQYDQVLRSATAARPSPRPALPSPVLPDANSVK